MSKLKLVFPTMQMEAEALDYVQEHFKHGETNIFGDGGLDNSKNYTQWMEKITADLTRDDETHVPSTTYFAIVENKIVGTLQIRHKLNDSLIQYGGHIGYGVRPSERNKGYASKMLAAALGKCREMGIENVLLTCERDNIHSENTIKKNGGVLDNCVNNIKRYWIKTNPKIRRVSSKELPQCLELIHKSFATVANDFGLTRENCPNHTSFIPLERLQNHMSWGWLMYGLYDGDELVGYASLSKDDEITYSIHNLAVLPVYRHMGYGKILLDYMKEKVREFEGQKIKIDIIEENTVLKNGTQQTDLHI